jgi:hypothetical protein
VGLASVPALLVSPVRTVVFPAIPEMPETEALLRVIDEASALAPAALALAVTTEP